MSKYYFLARLYFNIEEMFHNTDMKDREMYRRTTNMFNGFLFLHDIKNIVIIFRQESRENYNFSTFRRINVTTNLIIQISDAKIVRMVNKCAQI